MKFQIECGSLLKMLNRANQLIERRQLEAINTKVLMQVEDSKLHLYSRNSVVRLIDRHPLKEAQEGLVALDPRHLSSLLKELKSNEFVSLKKTEDNWIVLKQNKARAKIVAEDPKAYPIIEASKVKNFSTIKAPALFEMLSKISYGAAAENSSHKSMKGVYFERSKSSQRLVATDSHRLSVVDRDLKALGASQGAVLPTKGVVVPNRGINCLKSLLEPLKGEFKLAISDKELVAWVNDTCLMVNLINGTYPNYRKMIIPSPEKVVQVSKGALMSSLRRVLLLTDPSSHGLVLELLPNRLRITSTQSKIGQSKEEIDVDYKGAALRIGFNGQYVLEALNHIEDDEVEMSFKEPYLPGTVRYKKDAGHVSVVMPMEL